MEQDVDADREKGVHFGANIHLQHPGHRMSDETMMMMRREFWNHRTSCVTCLLEPV